MRCEYAHDDGAYVLGALAPAERAAYERHLGTCQTCRDAVAEIAVLPGLLGRLDPATALELLGVEQSDGAAGGGRRPVPAIGGDSGDDAKMNVLLAAAAKERRQARRRRGVRFASAMTAAACLALVATLGFNLARGGQLLPDGDPTAPGGGNQALPTQSAPAGQVHMAPMELVSNEIPVKAEIGLEQHSWGTQVTMECEYDGPEDEKQQSWRLHLVAFGPDNEHEQVASWKVAPDKPVKAKGSTRLVDDDLVRLELQKADGTVLLSYDVR